MDWYSEEVLFHIANAFDSEYSWFSLGFSARGGGTERNDLCIFQWQNEVLNRIMDAYTSEDGSVIYFDEQQDCTLLRLDDNSIAFKRKFDTCDPRDLAMHEGTMYVTWARGMETLNLDGAFIAAPNATYDEGISTVQLLRADSLNVPEK